MACSVAEGATNAVTTCPLSVKVQSRSVGKGFHCRASITITNTHDFPVWFVMAGAANNQLPYDGRLRNGSGWHTNDLFDAEAYDEGHGRVIIVSYYGTNAFMAILLPTRGQMRFDGFMFYSGTEPPRFVDFWEVKQLLVNGKTSLQDWMPFALDSSKDAHISGRIYSGQQVSLNFMHDNTAGAKPYPSEKVEYVKADVLEKYIVPLPE
jgi:hypothetical protein